MPIGIDFRRKWANGQASKLEKRKSVLSLQVRYFHFYSIFQQSHQQHQKAQTTEWTETPTHPRATRPVTITIHLKNELKVFRSLLLSTPLFGFESTKLCFRRLNVCECVSNLFTCKLCEPSEWTGKLSPFSDTYNRNVNMGHMDRFQRYSNLANNSIGSHLYYIYTHRLCVRACVCPKCEIKRM